MNDLTIKISAGAALQYSSITAYGLCATYPVLTSVPKAIIVTPRESIVDTRGNIAIQANVTGAPNLVKFYIKEQGTILWTLLGTDSVFPGDVTSYTFDTKTTCAENKSYDIKAEASNIIGTDPSVDVTWFKIDWSPRTNGLDYVKRNGQSLVALNGRYYVKASELGIRTNYYRKYNGTEEKMDISVIPAVKLTIGTQVINPTASGWDVIFDGGLNTTFYYLVSTFTVASIDTNGNAVFSVSGGKSIDNFSEVNYSNSNFVVDTNVPSVVSVRLDENGDGDFADNNGFVCAGEQPKIYVTFNEPVGIVQFSSFTPAGMTPLVGINEGPQDVNNTIYRVQSPVIAGNTTGDGLCTFSIGIVEDYAGNRVTNYTNSQAINIDATAPDMPIITLPVNGASADKGSVVGVTLQDPLDTDVRFAEIYIDGVKHVDCVKSYQAAGQVINSGAIQARYMDYAGNYSNIAALNIGIDLPSDRLAPLARITNIDDIAYPSIVLTASVNDDNANVKEVAFQYSSDGANWTAIGTDAVNTDGFSRAWNISGLSDGNYYLRTIATDTNGNTDSGPSITTINVFSIVQGGKKVIQTAAEVYKDTATYTTAADIDIASKKISITVNSEQQPTINVMLYEVATGSSEWILSSDLVITGVANSWSTSVTNSFIKTGVMARIITARKDSDGQVIIKECLVGTVVVDAKQDVNTLLTGAVDFGSYGLRINIPKGTLANNTVLIIEPVATPVKSPSTTSSSQKNLIPLGQTYDFSVEGRHYDNFGPVTLTFCYPAVVNGLFTGSNAEQVHLTVNYYDGTKWVRDRNITHIAATATSVQVTVKHFTRFSIVADYSNPVISDVKVNNRVVTAKVADEGSGVDTAASYLKVAGTNCAVYNYDEYTGNIEFRAANITRVTEVDSYAYILRVQDKAGNYSETSGVLPYSAILNSGSLLISNAHNYPNPFNPDTEDTTIVFTLSENSDITIKIYDLNGSLVSVLSRNNVEAYGVPKYKWGGTNDNGMKVANGVYLCEITASGSQLNNIGRTEKQIVKVTVSR